MQNYLVLFVFVFYLPILSKAQVVQDDFEGNGTITTWFGDNCNININLDNPFPQGINSSATVLEYHDNGGQYANVRFDVSNNFDLSTNNTFSIKIYVPSSGLTGNQSNQVSLKLQDGTLITPWSTQSEIIKPIILNQWQTVTFDFENDAYFNFDNNSFPPKGRTDFNRVVIQINGENNNDHVLAYIDDVNYYNTATTDPVFNNLVWSDEFDGNGAIDINNWFHQTQLPAQGSWYNNEQQHYTDRIDNSFIDNGVLNIIAKKEMFSDQGVTKQYTSARLNSKFAFQYGRVEIRAKLPTGVGTWPAIWMLGKNINEDGAYWDNQGFGITPWPACGEIDIMEHWGKNQNYIQSATHTPSSFGATVNIGGQNVSTASNDFHIYTLEWNSEKLKFSVDSVIHYIYNPPVKDGSNWPFNAEQYLLLNIAIESFVDPNFTQSSMEIDYIRVYQENTVSNVQVENKNNIRFYPNPITDELHITLDDGIGQMVTLKIINIDGKIIKTYIKPVINKNIRLKNLGYLNTGSYILTYKLNNKNYSLKFIKN